MTGQMKVLNGSGHAVLDLEKPEDLAQAKGLAASRRGSVFDAGTQERISNYDPEVHTDTIFVPQMAGG